MRQKYFSYQKLEKKIRLKLYESYKEYSYNYSNRSTIEIVMRM